MKYFLLFLFPEEVLSQDQILIVSFLTSSLALSYKQQAGKTKWPIRFKDEETFPLRVVDREISVEDPIPKNAPYFSFKKDSSKWRNRKCYKDMGAKWK